MASGLPPGSQRGETAQQCLPGACVATARALGSDKTEADGLDQAALDGYVDAAHDRLASAVELIGMLEQDARLRPCGRSKADPDTSEEIDPFQNRILIVFKD